MLALYRSNRPAEALDEYRAARQRLRSSVGTEPGPQLRQLQQSILREDPGLSAAMDPISTPAPHPAGLPSRLPTFAGREDAIAQLESLAPNDNEAPTAAIVVIACTAGIGKTTLAVYRAHRAAARFPDGNLYVNLQGYGPGSPAQPTTVLDDFLSAWASSRLTYRTTSTPRWRSTDHCSTSGVS
jgi:hypothetical protein